MAATTTNSYQAAGCGSPDAIPAEKRRLQEDARREKNWKRWGPYLSERQWGTVREDYSPDGSCWDYFTHDQARSRAYRWGEDGLLGFTDRECRLCFGLALWNGKDPILKERLYGLTNSEGNHGEDCKELYFYLDSTPTHSYVKGLYKYPHAAFPYNQLRQENAWRGSLKPEYEITDTAVFNNNRYFDIVAEYAKGGPDDILIRITAFNRGPDPAPLHILPTFWFRNTWIWGCEHEGCTLKPVIEKKAEDMLEASHETLGKFQIAIEPASDGSRTEWIFTENETNAGKLWGGEQYTPYVKDAFHEYIVNGRSGTLKPDGYGTKAAAVVATTVPPGRPVSVRLRLFAAGSVQGAPFGDEFEKIFDARISEAGEFYESVYPKSLSAEEKKIFRQAGSGLMCSKQFYHYSVRDWLRGDQGMVPPPAQRLAGRNAGWQHLFNRDIVSVPDKWEYPWYAAWDLAFHMIPFADIDPVFAQEQLLLFLREWYMHPSGKLPAYEFALDDVNPPVHAWACLQVYRAAEQNGRTEERRGGSREFLEKAFHKLLLNFTWWVNRKDPDSRNLFSGGFLGLDNIGPFDRSKPIHEGSDMKIAQADGTAWMAFYCSTMLEMALELARTNHAYEDVASKFFEHFVAISDAMNTFGGNGLWDEEDGFYYDQLSADGKTTPLKLRSIVGIIPLFAVGVLEPDALEALPGFRKRMDWFLKHRSDLSQQISWLVACSQGSGRRLLAVPSRERLLRVLKYLLDENEFLSPYGVRSLSKYHQRNPYMLRCEKSENTVSYAPGESTSGLFGGNSNWRGPVWLPINFLLIESLRKYHSFYGDSLKVEMPTGSGKFVNLDQVADELAGRIVSLFVIDERGSRPCCRNLHDLMDNDCCRDIVMFHEYFHGEDGHGLGASHQTGWTALVNSLLKSRK